MQSEHTTSIAVAVPSKSWIHLCLMVAGCLLISLFNTVVWSFMLKYDCCFLAGFCDGHLLVYSETHVDVFHCASGEWVQTINVKKAKPLNSAGTLSMCIINDMPHIIYLSNVHQRKSFQLQFSEIICPPFSLSLFPLPRWTKLQHYSRKPLILLVTSFSSLHFSTVYAFSSQHGSLCVVFQTFSCSILSHLLPYSFHVGDVFSYLVGPVLVFVFVLGISPWIQLSRALTIVCDSLVNIYISLSLSNF